MNVEECIKSRRSIRNFKEMEITNQILESIVETTRYSPSWKNSQTPRYTFVKSQEMREKLAECMMGFPFNERTAKECSVLVVISYVTGICGYNKDGSFNTSKEDRWEMFDAGIAAQTFCLSAYDKGIGSVILGIFDEYKVAQAIDLPKEQKVAALIAIGYSDSSPEAPKRKEVCDLIRAVL